MSDKELIQALRPLAVRDKFQCLGCGYEHRCSTHGCAIIKQAVERLEQLTGPEPNIPLTLEELRELDGEPVWVIPLDDFDILPANYLVNAYAEQIVVDKFGAYLDFEDYDKTWIAYRRKPEDGTT